jgi:hypothetical protein
LGTQQPGFTTAEQEGILQFAAAMRESVRSPVDRRDVGRDVGGGGGGNGGGGGGTRTHDESEPEGYASEKSWDEGRPKSTHSHFRNLLFAGKGQTDSDDGSHQEEEEEEERNFEDEDRASYGGMDQSPIAGQGEWDTESDLGQRNKEGEGDGGTDVEDEDPGTGGSDERDNGGDEATDVEAEDEATGNLDTSSTEVAEMVYLPARARAMVTMHGDVSEGEESGDGGRDGEKDEMETATSAVKNSGFRAFSITANSTAKHDVVLTEAIREAAVRRRPFAVSSMVTAGTSQPPVLVLPRKTSDERKQKNTELGSSSTGLQPKQRGPMAVDQAHQGKAASKQAKGPAPHPWWWSPHVDREYYQQSEAYLEENKGKITRRW